MGAFDLNAELQVVALILSLFALIISLWTQHVASRFTHYGELDKMYFDILKLGIEKPYLRDPTLIATDQERRSYDAYAFIVWNFIETIHDRCKKSHDLMSTWMPVVKAEHKIHGEWFGNAENAPKFKVAFSRWVAECFGPKAP